MPFQPGNNANPNGRPRKIDSRSEELQKFCKKYRLEINKTGVILLRKANVDQFPWAIKLVMEQFYPKPGTFVSITKEDRQEVNVLVQHVRENLTHEEEQTLWHLLQKRKKGIAAFGVSENKEEPEIIDAVIEPESKTD